MQSMMFDKARARARRRRFLATLTGRASSRRLPELEDVVPQPWKLTYVGVRFIPLQRIVGTVDGRRDFDRDFLPKTNSIGDRWRALERAFEYASFPPIVVYQAGDSFYVIDGHHRVAIARCWEIDSLEAEVTRVETLRSPSPRR